MDLAPLLRRNSTPWANIRINYYPNQFQRMVTVMDWHQPELAIRTKEWNPSKETLGYRQREEEAFAVICNMAWLEGECPMGNVPGVFGFDEDGNLTNKVIARPERGVKEAVAIMLQREVLEPTQEIGYLIGDWEMAGRARR